MAHQLGEMKVANLIVLGALMEKIPFLKTAFEEVASGWLLLAERSGLTGNVEEDWAR